MSLRSTTERALEAPGPPTSCPFCGAAKIAKQSEKVTSETYWRCEMCGEVWNASRLPGAAGRSRNRYGWDLD